MGLLDILNGMQNGPRGNRQANPQTTSQSSGGMSPLMMALIGLLAYKAMKGFGGGQQQPAPPPAQPLPRGGGTVQADNPMGGGSLTDLLGGLFGGKTTGSVPPSAGRQGGGGLSDVLGGGLGGLLGGAAAGSVLGGGLSNLIKDLQNSGQGRAAQSWVGTGPNEHIAPDDLANALGADTIDQLSNQTGMSREELLNGLSAELPDMVDQLTPHGRLPTDDETSRW